MLNKIYFTCLLHNIFSLIYSDGYLFYKLRSFICECLRFEKQRREKKKHNKKSYHKLTNMTTYYTEFLTLKVTINN